jgi:hypothetical protein
MRGLGALILAAALMVGETGQAQVRIPQEANGYTRYELLAPGSGKFRILYDITAVRPGATAFFNPIRKGSIASDERVTDLASGAPLKFQQVSGEAARRELPEADLGNDYIRVELARPVPAGGGGGRIRIDKTYEDAKSYHPEGRDIVFERSLGIKRNAVVLPPGYVLVECNYPSQVAQEADGRIRISFLNGTPAEAPLKLRATPGKLSRAASSQQPNLVERARQTRDIVYFLKDPQTHAFDLYHDYTEDRPGVGTYVNVVRTGSTASNPGAKNLDTGEEIRAEHLKGAEITAAGITDPDLPKITPETEVVVFRFKPLKVGQSIRLRMSETYTDPGRYRVVGDELVFERTFGRPANAVVLPPGWVLTNSAAPAMISRTPDGRTLLQFINPRPDELAVLITARRAGP